MGKEILKILLYFSLATMLVVSIKFTSMMFAGDSPEVLAAFSQDHRTPNEPIGNKVPLKP